LKYEQTLALLPERGIDLALELACAEGLFTRLLAPKVDRLIAADISSTALERARARCADLDNVQFCQFDLVVDALPDDLDLLVCSEVLYYLRDRQQLVEIAQKLHDALKPGGFFLTAHAMVLSDDLTRTGFDWEGHYGAKTIAEVFASTGTLQLMRSLQTELYRIDLYRRALPGETANETKVCLADFARPLDLDVERFVIWGGAVARRETLRATEKVRQVPILMYHRIADEGPAELSRYRTTPSAFEDQLRLLRRYGYHAITSSDLEFHIRSGQPHPGRPVMITFDDGYQDFYDIAWPILRRNDFTAEVFIVTDKVGYAADWDQQSSPPSPLMDWPAIRELQAQGVRFGSHLASHSAASTLPLDVLLRETVGSRAVLERRLGCDVTSIAPPFGIIDDRLWCCIELSGYATAFTTEDRIASLSDHPWFLPRVEVFGGEDLAAFAKRIGLDLDKAGRSKEVSRRQAPLVSIVVPAYNAESTIDETLYSVRWQTYAKLEIIVVDDGSTDSTAAHVLRNCTEDARVRLIRQPNQGLAAARNAGIASASSDYIAPVDADDLWHPAKIERQIAAMMAGGGEVGLVYTWYALIDEKSQITSSNPGPVDEGDVLQRMCRGNLIGNGSSPLMLRQAILEAGGYDSTLQDRLAQGCEDWKLYFQIAEKYKFAVIADHLTGYRQLPGSMSSNVPRMMRSYDMVMDSFLKKYPQYADDFRMGKSETLYWYLMQALRSSRWQDARMVARMMMKHDALFMLVRVCVKIPFKYLRRLSISKISRRLFHLFARPVRSGNPRFLVREKNTLATTKEQ